MKPEIPGSEPPVSPGNPPGIGADDDYPLTRLPDSSLPTPLPSSGLFAGRYLIVKELGRGGMGVVSQARDTRLPRDVAIKVPLRFLDPGSLRRFFKEAEAAAKLDHPHICRILDLGEADGVPYIVLAFVPGQTLAELVDHRPVAAIRAAKIIRSVARTIQFAHDRGIIHRDLKPANLMIGPHGELIVMDFGLARLEGDERKTLTGQILGTLPYMSPEQVQGQAADMGKGCDIYSLGVIFYELLTGRLPFRGAAWELPQQIIQVAPVAPSQIIPEIDAELDAIVLKAMAKEIRDRFASMDEFARAIAAYLLKVGSLSSSGLTSKVPARVESPAPHHSLEPSRPKPKRPDPVFWVQVQPEPLRGRRRRRPQSPGALIWGVVAILALIAVPVLLWLEG
jgi:serine/threonine protein kinase